MPVIEPVNDGPFRDWVWALLTSAAQPALIGAPENWLVRAVEQGMVGLLSERLAAIDAAAPERLTQLALAHLARDQEIKRVASALAEEGIEMIAFKGAAVSRWLYQPGYLRPRSDTDVLLQQAQMPQLTTRLQALGYAAVISANAGPVLMERSFWRTDARGVRHVIDAHWCINSHPRLRHALSFERLKSRAQPAADLGVLCPARTDQFILAVIHLFGHQRELPARMIWWVDVDRMWRAFNAQQRAQLIADALQVKVGALCAAALSYTATVLHTPLDEAEVAALRAQQNLEPSAVLLRYRGRVTELLLDLAALGSWRARLDWLRDLALPPADYLQQRYGLEKLPPWRLSMRRAWAFVRRP